MVSGLVGFAVSAGRVSEAVHQDPAWWDRSNFIIAAPVSDGGDIKTEQLWARKDDKGGFEVCCIPFFAYDLALGDVVEADAEYLVRRVIRPSGRFVFRVWFGESFQPRDEVADELKALGSLIEWSSRNLLARGCGRGGARAASGRFSIGAREGRPTGLRDRSFLISRRSSALECTPYFCFR